MVYSKSINEFCRDVIMPRATTPTFKTMIVTQEEPIVSNGRRSAVASASENRGVDNARRAKQDEFYTGLEEISNELKYYREHLRGKVVFCNCDDPYESNFFKYFALNFNSIGLKKLIVTSYKKSPIAGRQLPLLDIEGLKPDGKEPYALEVNEIPDHNNDGTTDLTDVEFLLRHDANTARTLKGDGSYSPGDFRSPECVAFLEQADVVITNPPFSLFREYVAQLIKHDKSFLIIGNVNAVSYKEIFSLIRSDKLWLGMSIHSGDREFRVPDHYPLHAAGFRVDEHGNKYIRVKGVRWFTNMDIPQRHEEIPLYKTYSREEYPKYDNYDAINVNKVSDIPVGYDGMMGVPITFLDKYNPTQFEIIGLAASAGYNAEIVGIKKDPRFKDARTLLRGKNLYARIFIRKKTQPLRVKKTK